MRQIEIDGKLNGMATHKWLINDDSARVYWWSPESSDFEQGVTAGLEVWDAEHNTGLHLDDVRSLEEAELVVQLVETRLSRLACIELLSGYLGMFNIT